MGPGVSWGITLGSRIMSTRIEFRTQPAVWKLWKPPSDPNELEEWIRLNHVTIQEIEVMELLKLRRLLRRGVQTRYVIP